MSNNEQLDPRVRRTRKWLQQALIDLLKEKKYQDISIAEITDRADVARPTFYLHYGSKDDLLVSILDGIFDEYVEKIANLAEYGGGLLTIKMFEKIKEYHEIIQFTMNSETSALVLDRFHHYFEYSFRMFIRKNIFPPEKLNEDLLDYAVMSTVGASISLIVHWINKGMPYSPEVMGRMLFDLTRPGLVDVLINQSLSDIL